VSSSSTAPEIWLFPPVASGVEAEEEEETREECGEGECDGGAEIEELGVG